MSQSPLYYILKQFPYGLKGEGWDVEALCKNKQFPWQYLREHPEGIYSMVNGELKLVDYDYNRLSRHNNLDWSLVRDFPDKDWDYDLLSYREDLDWSLVRDFPDKDWDYNYLSEREDLDIQLVKDFPNRPWNRDHVKIVDINEVLSNLDSYSTQQLSSIIYDGKLSGVMTKSARNAR